MRLLITGGAGFIGTNVALTARNKEYEVVVFDSLIRKGVEDNLPILKEKGVKIFRGDIRCKEDFLRLSTEYPQGFDGIIHLAGNPGIPWSIAYPDYDFAVNAQGTLNVLNFSKENGKIPVIYASTNKCYSDLINIIPLQETDTRYIWDANQYRLLLHPIESAKRSDVFVLKEGFDTRYGVAEKFPTDGLGSYPHSPYGVSKLAGDYYCQEYFHTYEVPTVINRMSCIYGYYQKGVADQGWIDHFIRQTFTNTPHVDIFGDGKQVRDMLWGEDVAELYLKELEEINKVKGEIFNIGGGILNTLSLKEAIKEIETISGKTFDISYFPWRHADQKIYISDTRKVTEILGWNQKVTPQEGIKRIYERYKSS